MSLEETEDNQHRERPQPTSGFKPRTLLLWGNGANHIPLCSCYWKTDGADMHESCQDFTSPCLPSDEYLSQYWSTSWVRNFGERTFHCHMCQKWINCSCLQKYVSNWNGVNWGTLFWCSQYNIQFQSCSCFNIWKKNSVVSFSYMTFSLCGLVEPHLCL